MGVNRVQREIDGGWQLDDLGAGSGQCVTQRRVLFLGEGEIRCVMKSEFAPAGDLFGAAPSGGAGRAHPHPLERGNHGMAIADNRGFRPSRQWATSFARAAVGVILRQSCVKTKTRARRQGRAGLRIRICRPGYSTSIRTSLRTSLPGEANSAWSV